LFHTKMRLKDFDLDNYLFGIHPEDISKRERARIERRLRKEMQELFYGRNL
ncbi:MAG: S-adenosylmethionine decarboxylase, partial [Wenzhouxiangella sp.]|nr:S-adenosylmethionine decarboxylase [Wenzhouxiangella sp.]